VTGLTFLLAFASLPIIGLGIWGLPGVAKLPLAGRAAAAGAAGMVFLSLEMLLFSLLGVPWSIPLLVPLPLAAAGAGLWLWQKMRPMSEPRPRAARLSLILTASALSLVVYAAATARATSVDLLLVWGPKGLRFAAARALDYAFLASPVGQAMHSDYPPLVAFLYAWATLAAGRFAWGAALLTMPFFLLLATLAFWGFARRPLGDRRAAELTALFAALFGYTCVVSLTAGNADPALLFFETVALAALTFGEGRPESDWLASLALAGAVLTKVEGAAFAAIVTACFLLLGRHQGRRLGSLWRLAAAPFGLLALWLLFAARHGILQSYRTEQYGEFSLAHWRDVASGVLASASYGAAYLPWIALALLVVLGPSPRRALPPLAAAAGYTVFILYSYMRGEFDPRLWIEWSAARLLLTPLLCLIFAAAAGSGGVTQTSGPEASRDLEEKPVNLER